MNCVDGRKSNGHVAATCHTLRCYMCSGFGHKAQECASQRNQSRRSPLYTSARRIGEPWKKTTARSFEDQKRRTYSQGHAQGWRKEVDQRSDGSFTSSARCWSCNRFGHKAQNCWNTMRRLTYSSAKTTNKDNGENDEKIDAKKQVWMKKNNLLNLNEIKDQYKKGDDDCHMAI